MAILVHAGETRVLVRGTDDHLYEGAVMIGGDWRTWRDLGGVMRSRPHIAHVAVNALPRPANAFGPDPTIPAGRYLCTIGTDGFTWARRLGSVDWDPWTRFADGNSRIVRPLHVSWPLGFASIPQGSPVALASQAGWIGRTTSGEIQSQAMWWQQVIKQRFISFTSLNNTPWTTIGPNVASHPVGLTIYEPVTSGDLIEPTMWMFARLQHGALVAAAIQQLAPAGSTNWNGFGGSGQGDPALLSIWERYEDAKLLHVLSIDSSGQLQARRGGFEAEPARVRPLPSGPRGPVILEP